ncbi:MAG TPA: hypothetical protein VL240_12995 [Candidatus Binatia bacterium]|nr:hypothetical protein [Candidatus Binatia bacterium]
MSTEPLATVLRFALYLCIALVPLPSAMAQKAQSTADPARHADESGPTQYIPAVPSTPADYRPVTGEGRFFWFVRSTIGPRSLTAGVFSAGVGTALNHPHEYGPHWEGFGQRYGMRLTGISTGNAMNAGLGAIWGEDPRYFHTVHQPFGSRIRNVLDLTFRAYGRDGERHPAYAMYIGTFGNNFLSNTWRVNSEADWQHAMIRSAEGFGGRAVSNVVSEFWQTLWRRVHHGSDADQANVNQP